MAVLVKRMRTIEYIFWNVKGNMILQHTVILSIHLNIKELLEKEIYLELYSKYVTSKVEKARL